MANITLKGLLNEAEDFQARSKETGKLVHFKSKDAYQAALKAGSHEDPKAKKAGTSNGTKPNDMFGGDYAKDRGAVAPKADAMATVNTIAAKTGLRAQAVAGWADENGVNLSKVSADIDSKKLKPMDLMTAVSGNPGNKYAKDIIAKYSQSAPKSDNIEALTSYKDFNKFFKSNVDKLDKKEVAYIEDEIGALKYLESDYKRGDADREEVETAYIELQDLIKKALVKNTPKSDMGVDKVVYNTRTKTVGIVRIADERGETKTDADGNVNTSELEPYNPMKYPHQKDAKVAPSTKKEVDKRGLYNPFAQDKETSKEEPTSKPKEARKGNSDVNKKVIDTALKLDITPMKYATSAYEEKIGQAAVEALTDANFHQEARELIAKLEGKPEWAEDPNKVAPKYGTDEYTKWRKTSVYSSKYYDGDNDARKLGIAASQESGWDGVIAVDAIAAQARKMGSDKLADTLQSIFDNKPYMKEQSTKLTSMIKSTNEAEDFQAKSKQTGKLVHFKSKDAYQAALKAGSHEDPKAKKGEQPKVAGNQNSMFGGDYAKDRVSKATSKSNTNWMDDLDSIDVSDVKGKADPNADSWTHGDVFGATFKDPQTGKPISVGDAYDREDDSPAYQKAFAYVAQFNPDDEAVMGTQAYDDLNKKSEPSSKLTSMLPKNADGPKINGKNQTTPNRQFDKKKPFDPKEIEKDVTDMLKSDGYEVEHQWGTNDYFLNISKKDKKGKEVERYTIQKNPKTGTADVWDAIAKQWVVEGEPNIDRLYDTIGQIPYFRED